MDLTPQEFSSMYTNVNIKGLRASLRPALDNENEASSWFFWCTTVCPVLASSSSFASIVLSLMVADRSKYTTCFCRLADQGCCDARERPGPVRLGMWLCAVWTQRIFVCLLLCRSLAALHFPFASWSYVWFCNLLAAVLGIQRCAASGVRCVQTLCMACLLHVLRECSSGLSVPMRVLRIVSGVRGPARGVDSTKPTRVGCVHTLKVSSKGRRAGTRRLRRRFVLQQCQSFERTLCHSC